MDKDDQIADELIARQITLFRFASGERGRILAILRQMEDDLVELLFYSGKKLTDIGREDKARLLRQAQAVINEYYGKAGDQVGESLAGLAHLEAEAYAATLATAFRSAIEPALPTEAVLRKLAGDTLIQGAPSADWWKRQAGDVAFRFKTAVAQGLAQSETNDQIIRRIRGSATGFTMVDGKRVYTYAGGVMDIARHNAAALVQTSVQAVANAARRETMLANDDVVKGLRQVSTLDGHTTKTCVAYSGAAWSLPGYKPTAPNKLPYNGGTPRHWNCRSVEIPITRTFRELGIDLPEFDPASTTRSAHGGPIAADMSFNAFLRRKPDSFADDLLGPGRAQLWRDRKITLQQLLDQNGRELSLAELRRLYGR
jgi:hypothetical protein